MKDNTIMIQGTEILIKGWCGRRVVTLKDIDKVHQRPERTARKCFNANRKHFARGVHFFKATPDEFNREVGYVDGYQTNDIFLITASGYSVIAKQYTSDRDRHVTRSMMMDYFGLAEECKAETDAQTGVMNISGVDCYEKDGTVYLRLETVARGLGFTTTQTVKGTEYTNVRWNRVDEYLEEIGFATCGKRPEFIPENIFYRLAMKAKNETAEKFQAKVADEIIPAIRKTGTYSIKQEEPERKETHEETETVTVSMMETEKLIRCGEIMAGCLEGNRPYVLNILRHIIPDIDRMEQETAEVEINGDVVKVPVSEDKTVMVVSRAYGKPFNHDKFDRYLKDNNIKTYWLQTEIGCSDGCISKWRYGYVNPTEGYRIKICEALGVPIGYFDKKVRKRR